MTIGNTFASSAQNSAARNRAAKAKVLLRVVAVAMGTMLASYASGQVLEGTILLPDSLGPLTGISHVAFDEDPDHPRMFIGSEDGNVLVISTRTGERLARIQSGRVNSLCFSPAHNKLYISFVDEYSVAVVDCSSYQVITELPLDSLVTGLLYNPLVDRVYCATWCVPVIDCSTDCIVDSIQVEGRKVRLALDSVHNKLYVGSTDTFRVADCNADSVIASIPDLEETEALCFQPSAGKMYISTGDGLSAIDTKSDTLVYRQGFATLDPQFACDPVHNRLYYTLSGYVIALDCASDSMIWSQELWARAVAMAVDPKQDKLFLLLYGLGHGYEYVLDGATGQTLRDYHYTQDSSLYYSAAADRVFLIWNGGEVTAFDCHADTVVWVTPLSPHITNMCLDSADNKLYFSVGKSGVGIVDCATGKVKSYARASGPLRYLTFDSRDDKLYCSSDSSIFVLDGETDSVVNMIPLRAWTMTVNWLPTLDKLYAISYSHDTAGLVIIDCSADTVSGIIDLTWPHYVTLLSPELNQLWLIAGGYKVVDCLSDSMVTDSSAELNCRAGTYDPSNRRVYAVSDTAMYVIDMETRLPVDSLPLTGDQNRWSRQVYCAARSRKVYWITLNAFPPEDTVIGVDTRVDSFVSRFTVPFPSQGVCDDRTGDYVYFASDHLIALDTRTDSVVSSVHLPLQTEFLVRNSGTSRLYLAGLTDSVIQVVYDSVVFAGLQAAAGSPAETGRLQTVLSRSAPFRSPTESAVFDASGRRAAMLRTGLNDISHLAPGVYFVREEPQASSSKPQAVRKIVVAR